MPSTAPAAIRSRHRFPPGRPAAARPPAAAGAGVRWHAALLGLCLLSSTASADRIAVIVHPENQLSRLNQQEVAAIFLGQNQGIGHQPLRPFDLAYDDPLREEFYRRIANLSLAQVQSRWARLLFAGRAAVPKAATSIQELLQLVGDRPEAIAYIDAAAVDERKVKVVYVLP